MHTVDCGPVTQAMNVQEWLSLQIVLGSWMPGRPDISKVEPIAAWDREKEAAAPQKKAAAPPKKQHVKNV